MLANASKKSLGLVSKGHHLHENIIYYYVAVVQTFVCTAAQHECVFLVELAPLCTDDSWAGWITACLVSEALSCIMEFIHPVDKNARVKDASAISRGRGRKRLIFGDNRWSKTYVPFGPHTVLRVRGTGGKEGTFVEEAAVTFTN